MLKHLIMLFSLFIYANWKVFVFVLLRSWLVIDDGGAYVMWCKLGKLACRLASLVASLLLQLWRLTSSPNSNNGQSNDHVIIPDYVRLGRLIRLYAFTIIAQFHNLASSSKGENRRSSSLLNRYLAFDLTQPKFLWAAACFYLCRLTIV